MEMKVFELDANGKMVRIENPENGIKNNLPIGTVLHWGGNMAWHAQDYAIIGRNESSWGLSYTVISLETYQENRTEAMHLKQENDPSVWHSQHYFITDKVLSGDEVLDLVEKSKIKKAQIKEAVELEAIRKEEQKKNQIKNFPYLTPESYGGSATKNMKTELKRAFPSVKFSVRFDHPGAINVSWIDGPTVEEVKKITGKYEEGSFDGMTDSYNYDHRQTWTDVFGGARYVFEYRNTSKVVVK